MARLDPDKTFPMVMPDGTAIRTVVHLSRVIDHPRITVGDFTYFGHLTELDDHAAFLAPYLFPLSPERLVIGRFCQIAHGVRFVTSSANHNMSGFSTYPFDIFTMHEGMITEDLRATFNVPGRKGDTVVGNDVWFGMEALVMPGVTIGDGAIIGARAVVAQDVAPYTVVTGNPARPVRTRYDAPTVAALQALAWWDWPVEVIETNRAAITGADLAALKRVAREVDAAR